MLQNLGRGAVTATASTSTTHDNDEEEEGDYDDIPPEIEEVIDTMLTGLRDKVSEKKCFPLTMHHIDIDIYSSH